MTDCATAAPRATAFPLLTELFAALATHRAAFRQERPYRRACGLVVGWLLAFERHTITRVLAALGLVAADWSGFYRLLATPGFGYDALARHLLRRTLPLAPAARPYAVVLDGVLVPRASCKMPGTSWHKAAGTAPFQPGIARAQRFVDCCWLPAPTAGGYSRAVPLRWEDAFPPKAVPAADRTARTEAGAGLAALAWVRRELDAAGRPDQRLLAIADNSFDAKAVWTDLPAGVDLLVRTAKNRALFALPPAATGRGRRPRRRGWPSAPAGGRPPWRCGGGPSP